MEDALIGTIAASLAEWEVPHVELAIFGTADASHIATRLRDFCVSTLGSPPAQMLFYTASVGAVAGLELANGRRVVVKAHQPSTPSAHLEEIVRLQATVESRLSLAPKVLAGPLPFGRGAATVEELVDRGIVRNGHDAVIRRELARSLHAIVECLLPLYVFDFAATTRGAEYIDELAAQARTRMMPAGRRIIGHCDWRAEHVRFDGDLPTVGFDWDSLHKITEPALVGSAAHMFCADWSKSHHVQAPTLEEARSFVSEYEVARDRSFTRAERTLCGASFVFSVAYTCRCGHAAGVDARDVPGNFQHFLAKEGERMFAL